LVATLDDGTTEQASGRRSFTITVEQPTSDEFQALLRQLQSFCVSLLELLRSLMSLFWYRV